MIPKINSVNFQTSVVHNMDFEYMDIGEQLAVYRIAKSVLTVTDKKVFHDLTTGEKTETQGICALKDAKALASNKITDIHFSRLYFANDKVLEDFKAMGFQDAISENNELLGSTKFFDNVKSGAIDLATHKVIRIDIGNHRVSDPNGNWLPFSINYSYMDGNMDNSKYDLNQVLTTLVGNPQITWFDPEHRSYRKKDHSPKIHSIPSYNAEGGRSAFLNFRFAPTAEQILELQKAVKAMNVKFDTNDYIRYAIKQMDLLGIEQFYCPKVYQDDDEEDEEN